MESHFYIFQPKIKGNTMKGSIAAPKNRAIPIRVLKFFRSIIPLAINTIPTNARIGGIIWENINELITGLSAIYYHLKNLLMNLLLNLLKYILIFWSINLNCATS